MRRRRCESYERVSALGMFQLPFCGDIKGGANEGYLRCRKEKKNIEIAISAPPKRGRYSNKIQCMVLSLSCAAHRKAGLLYGLFNFQGGSWQGLSEVASQPIVHIHTDTRSTRRFIGAAACQDGLASRNQVCSRTQGPPDPFGSIGHVASLRHVDRYRRWSDFVGMGLFAAGSSSVPKCLFKASVIARTNRMSVAYGALATSSSNDCSLPSRCTFM
jgi:hypothetical protein